VGEQVADGPKPEPGKAAAHRGANLWKRLHTGLERLGPWCTAGAGPAWRRFYAGEADGQPGLCESVWHRDRV
jgi:hypothetical protein